MNLKGILILAVLLTTVKSAILISANLLKPKLKYNIILISVDTLRPDHMGVYGYNKNTTPNIDAWAKNATVFTNMRTQIPITYPSFSILLTGKSVFESGIINNEVDSNSYRPSSGWIPIDSKTKTLAQALKENGYTTGAFMNTASLYAPPTELGRGFDVYWNNFEIPTSGPNQKQQYKSYTSTVQGLNWLDKNKYKKFFIWIHLMEPHWPYFPQNDL